MSSDEESKGGGDEVGADGGLCGLAALAGDAMSNEGVFSVFPYARIRCVQEPHKIPISDHLSHTP